jgi:hypothetical protein
MLPQDPVFIVGYPRSGTTLLQRLLVAQPGFYSFPETHYFCVIEKKIQWGEARENIPPGALPAIFENLEKKMELRLAVAEQMDLQQQAADKKLTSKALFEHIVSRYLGTLYPEIAATAHFRWIEKTPNHAHFLERIMAMYPCAQVLHILRHPVPAIYSRKLKFPFNRETPVTELAHRWNRMLLDVERFKERYFSHIFTLRYEDLVQDMEKQLREVADFLQVGFDFDIVAGMKQENERNPGAFILPSETWKQEDLRLDMRATNEKYHGLIPAADVAAIEEIVMENMTRYGYEPFSAGMK